MAMLDLPPEKSLGNILVRDTELLPRNEAEKLSILDALFELPDGEKVLVEMQFSRFPEMKARLIHEWARIASGQLARGQDYGDFRRVVSVLISEHDLIGDSLHYIHRYKLFDKKADSLCQ